MKITLVIGEGQVPLWLKELEHNFSEKISRFCRFEIKRAKVEDRPDSIWTRSAQSQGGHIAFDLEGASLSTDELEALFSRWTVSGMSQFYFYIGGPYGFPNQWKSQFRGKFLTLSPFLMSHQIAEALVLEQIYRVLSIRNNTPYHHSD